MKNNYKYKKELLSQEYRNMSLETAMEYYPELMKKFRDIKKSTMNKIKVINSKKKDKRLNEISKGGVRVIEQVKSLTEDNIDYISNVFGNIENLPYLYVMDKIDEKVVGVVNRGYPKAFKFAERCIDWCHSEDKYYNSKSHRFQIKVLATVKEFIKLTLEQR